MSAASELQPPSPGRLAGRLRILFWVTVVYVGVALVRAVLTNMAVSELTGSSDHYQAIFDRLKLYDTLFPPLMITCLALFGSTVASCSRTRGGGLFIASAVMSFVAAAVLSVLWISPLAHHQTSRGVSEVLWTIYIVCEPLALGLAMGGLVRLLAGTGERGVVALLWAAAPFLAWPILFYLAQMHGKLRIQSAWGNFFLGTLLWSFGAAWLLYFVARVRGKLLGVSEARAAEPVDLDNLGAAWLPAADGLRLYANALSWRLGITVFGYLFLFMGALGGSRSMVQLVAWVLPLAAVITGIAMVVGIYHFSQQPAHSPARAPAWVAFAGMLCTSLADLASVVTALGALGVDRHDYRAIDRAMAAAHDAQTLSLIAMGVGFFSLLVLLVAFGKLANFIGPTRLFGRVVGIAGAIVMVALAVIGFRAAVGASIDLGSVVAGGVLIIGFALITLIAYIGLVRAFEQSIRQRLGATQALPAARIV